MSPFQAHVAETIGGFLPQVRYAHDGDRSIVIWQGELIPYETENAHDIAQGIGERRIAEVVVGLFQDRSGSVPPKTEISATE